MTLRRRYAAVAYNPADHVSAAPLRRGPAAVYGVVVQALIASVILAACGVYTTAQLQPMPGLDIPEDPAPCQGQTPAKLIFDRVVAYPQDGSSVQVVLRNVGGQTANLTGYRLTDSDTRSVDAAMNYVFGQQPCDATQNTTIQPGRTLELTPKSDTNPCGFSFGISFRDEVNLFDPAGNPVASAKWQNSNMGSALRLLPSVSTVTATGSEAYNDAAPIVRELPENVPVLQVLEALGGYTVFLEALKKTGLADQLAASSDPNYQGPPAEPKKKEKDINPEFPWWFGFGIDRSKLAPSPSPAPSPLPDFQGIPAEGPYTILAPTDAAFDTLLLQLGGGRKLPKERLLGLPELADILLYHILPGRYLTNDMYNNTGIYTAKNVEVTPFVDPCMNEGRVMLHDGCVDKPTPDNYTCDDQVVFNKCYFPFMVSALAAQWQGGFCQRTCQRCSCKEGAGVACAQIILPDARAGNGVVHGVSRVLFPPPAFNKTMIINEALASALASSTGEYKAAAGDEAKVVQAGLPAAVGGAAITPSTPQPPAEAEPSTTTDGGATATVPSSEDSSSSESSAAGAASGSGSSPSAPSSGGGGSGSSGSSSSSPQVTQQSRS